MRFRFFLLIPIQNYTMDYSHIIWSFSSTLGSLYGKDPKTSLLLKQISVDLCPSEIIDICTTRKKSYILLCSKLHSVKFSNLSLKKHELPLSNYQALISSSNQIYIIGNYSLKFDVNSKLCRKLSISLQNSKILTKTSYQDHLYMLINSQEKGTESLICTYNTIKDTTNVYKLQERLDYMGHSLGFIKDNSLFVFGGKYCMGWASLDFFRIELENLRIEYLKPMIKSGIFNVNSFHLTSSKVAAVDCSGFMHVYDFSNCKWKMYSEKHWKQRVAFLWLWKKLTDLNSLQPIAQLKQPIVRKLLVEYF